MHRYFSSLCSIAASLLIFYPLDDLTPCTELFDQPASYLHKIGITFRRKTIQPLPILENCFHICRYGVLQKVLSCSDAPLAENFSKILSLCVTRPDPESVRSASVYAGLVSRLSPVWAKYILNCFSSNAVGKGNGLDLLTDRVGLPLLGVVPQSGEMAKCLCCGQSLKRGTAKGAFERIAGRICGQSIPLPDLGRI